MHKDEAEGGTEVLGSLMILQSAAMTRLVVDGTTSTFSSWGILLQLPDSVFPPLLNRLTNALF